VRLDASDLPEGVYVTNIVADGKVVQSIKTIK